MQYFLYKLNNYQNLLYNTSGAKIYINNCKFRNASILVKKIKKSNKFNNCSMKFLQLMNSYWANMSNVYSTGNLL